MEATIYETLGGEPSLDELVINFYEACSNDKVVKGFFRKERMKYLQGQMKSFLGHVLGKEPYNGKSMREAHAHLKIEPKHFDRILQIFEAKLREILQKKLGTASTKDDIQNIVESVIDIAETTRNDVLGKEL